MMIVLGILKWIGIILLWILVILLIALLYLMICPFHLRARCGYQDKPWAKTSVRGFIHFWQIDWHYIGKEDTGLAVKMLWGLVTIYPRKPKYEKKEKPAHEIPAIDQSTAESEDDTASVNAEEARETGASVDQNVADQNTANAEDAVTAEDQQKPEEEQDARREHHTSGMKREHHSHRKPVHHSASGKSSLRERLEPILSMVRDPSFKPSIGVIMNQIGWLLKMMRFNPGGTDIRFSLGDPEITGYVMGALTLLPFLYQRDVNLVPDFESDDPYFRGNAQMNAILSAGMLVWIVIRLLINRDTRHMIHVVRTMKKK